jgi:uncharacterized protein
LIAEGDAFWFEPDANSGVFVRAPQAMRSTSGGSALQYRLAADASGIPSWVRVGDASFMLIERGGRYALRVRDAQAETRTRFNGVDRYTPDGSWRFEAEWTELPEPRMFDIQTVIGTVEPTRSPGYFRFERDGRVHEVYAMAEADSEEYFVIFADRSNGRETYGAGRFLYVPKPVNGRVQVDFNQAYNPPCAFNEYSTCPLPPPENRLDLWVRAGEKKYAMEVAAH